jgi:hypothetical protein
MFDKRDLPLHAFFAITIISAGLLVLPMWNYSMFYLAWSRIDYNVSKVAINATQVSVTSNLAVNITFLVTNPTDYSGLRVGYATCNLQYFDGEHQVPVIVGGRPTGQWVLSNLSDLKIGSDPQWYQIDPNGNRTISFAVIINANSGNSYQQQYALDFLVYLGNKPNKIEWFLSCDLYVNSFLGNLDAGQKYFQLETPWS